jgi:TRAP-type C4-dicarboxylate transport system substrate-binding protein
MLYINEGLLSGMPEELKNIVIKGGLAAQEYMFSEVSNIEKNGLESLKNTDKITIVEGMENVADAYKKAAAAAKDEYYKLVGEARGKELLESLESTLKNTK